MHTVPTIHTQRLILRPPTLENAPDIQRNFQDYELIKTLSSLVPWPYPSNGAIQFLTNVVFPNQGKNRWAWGLFLQQQPDTLVGMIDLWRVGRPEHRGFWLSRSLWGQGLMTEAVCPVHDFAFNQLGFDVLILSNASGNIASRRIKEKTGAVLIDVRPAKFVDPQYTSHEIWSLTKEAWTSWKKHRKL